MANELKLRRTAMDLSQEELAKKSGVSRGTIIRLEQGKTYVASTGTIIKLAKALECSLSDLFPSESLTN